ncbi:hypothetical protein JTB14_006322 [Gonioctena quinquepunctata]|nr:hypothetical protein JTB14_006322 [Gonioctena quinquepunctata]
MWKRRKISTATVRVQVHCQGWARTDARAPAMRPHRLCGASLGPLRARCSYCVITGPPGSVCVYIGDGVTLFSPVRQPEKLGVPGVAKVTRFSAGAKRDGFKAASLNYDRMATEFMYVANNLPARSD